MTLKITPLHDAHAIESVSFGVEWTLPLPPAVMEALGAVYESSLIKELPSKKPIQRVAFEINPESGNSISQDQSAGWTFERFSPDGRVDRSMLLTSNTLAVTFHNYSRWDDEYAVAANLMNPLLPLIAVSTGGFTGFGLQYLDVFQITGGPGEFKAEMLLRQNSEILPASVFRQKSLWHSHHGYFTDMPDEPSRRKLTVINTDLIDENNGSQQLRILTVHKTIFSVPLSDTEQIRAADQSPLDAAMHDMHNENKAVLRSLLNDSMLARISLNAEEGT